MPPYEAYPFLNKGPRSARYTPGLTARPASRPNPTLNGRHPSKAGSKPPQPREAVLKSQQGWQTWSVMSFEIRNLPRDITTFQLYSTFGKHGSITRIDIFEDPNGNRKGNAKIVFAPPPYDDFWSKGAYQMELPEHAGYRLVNIVPGTPNRKFEVISPIRRYITYPETMKLYPKALDFGFMIDQTTMMDMHTVGVNYDRNKFVFQVDLRLKRLNVHFQCKRETLNDYFFRIPFGQLQKVHEVEVDDDHFAFIISLKSPPQFFRRLDDIKISHSEKASSWIEMDSWYRQTDIVQNTNHLQRATISLQKPTPVIDIGRWTTYRFTFEKARTDSITHEKIKSALLDFNIPIIPLSEHKHCPAQQASVWSFLDHQSSPETDPYGLSQLQGTINLPFSVRYQLEVCISQGVLNEHNLGQEFVTTLASLANGDEKKARNILEYFANEDNRVYDPMSIFQDEEAQAYSPHTKIPEYCAYVRKATITPSSIIYSSPTVETSNRVIRKFERHGDRFLRVQFTDEAFEGRINSSAHMNTNDAVFTRVFRTLANGITIGDRHYVFLAFGNSQFRENGAYFFCPAPDLSAADIRQWMGDFTKINVVAKYAARLGQCFSTTRDIKSARTGTKIVTIPDIERNGWTFTDGVGKIGQFLADMIAIDFGLPTPGPSAFQFRMGGCKGILAVDPNIQNREIHIRQSQEKFKVAYLGLEVIRCSRYSIATLNRQTITILSSLGVEDEVFTKMLTEQLSNYQIAMSDKMMALNLLQRYIDDNHTTVAIAGMILNGFMEGAEPFVMSLLHLWRAWSIKLLKEKARIIVEDGAFLLGCVDETQTLRGHIEKPSLGPGRPARRKASELPQIFVQVPDRSSDKKGKYVVIKGICLVGRNPSLHPGDLRVVQAIDVPALHHLRDVIVFPSNGDRDVPSMCSGGDLDGDDFFVIWDKELTPKEWNFPPMNYAPPRPRVLDRPVVISDLMKFFVRYMKNDALPTIAHAHLGQCDFLDRGPKDPRALELADLHSKAVDYVKTGEPAEMPKRLRLRRWPHFMEKHGKESYESRKVLGQLYNLVERVDFIPQYEKTFDRRILSAYKLDNSLLKAARQVKSEYDVAMKRVMAQHEIGTEFEVWTSFVLSRARLSSDYKLQEEMGRISDSLKDRFRDICILRAGGKEFNTLGPFVAAMYRVTWEEMLFALQECSETKISGGREVPKRKKEAKYMPLISFPWLFPDLLGRIASGIDTQHELEDLGLGHNRSTRPRRNNKDSLPESRENGYIVTNGGITYYGEVLDVFNQDNGKEDNDIADVSNNEFLDQEDLIDIGGSDTEGIENAITDLDFGLDAMLNATPHHTSDTSNPSDDFAQTRAPTEIEMLISEDSLQNSADELSEVFEQHSATSVEVSTPASETWGSAAGDKTATEEVVAEDPYRKLIELTAENYSEIPNIDTTTRSSEVPIDDFVEERMIYEESDEDSEEDPYEKLMRMNGEA